MFINYWARVLTKGLNLLPKRFSITTSKAMTQEVHAFHFHIFYSFSMYDWGDLINLDESSITHIKYDPTKIIMTILVMPHTLQ